jgi:hypothetical protein
MEQLGLGSLDPLKAATGDDKPTSSFAFEKGI